MLSGTMSVPRPWTILLLRMPARKGRIESAADGGRTRLRCREARANEIFGCASNNRNPIDRQIRLMGFDEKRAGGVVGIREEQDHVGL